MNECEFCGEEFETEEDLHSHEEHEHQEELEKESEEVNDGSEELYERTEKKDLVFKSVISVLVLTAAALIIPQILSEAPETISQNGTQGFNLQNQPFLGDENASVTVVEFGDYKCPACKNFEENVKPRIKEEFIETGQVRFYFLNYPFLNNPGDSSTTAAVAGECMLRQNNEQFWDYHTAIYSNQGDSTEDWATEEKLMSIARDSTQDVNYTEFEQCLTTQNSIEAVSSDKGQGIAANVGETPTIFVNGHLADEPTYPAIKSLIEQELNE